MEIGGGGLLCSIATIAEAMTEQAMSQLEGRAGHFFPPWESRDATPTTSMKAVSKDLTRDAKRSNLLHLRRRSAGSGGNRRQASANLLESVQERPRRP
jgi:hypothetical protein